MDTVNLNSNRVYHFDAHLTTLVDFTNSRLSCYISNNGNRDLFCDYANNGLCFFLICLTYEDFRSKNTN